MKEPDAIDQTKGKRHNGREHTRTGTGVDTLRRALLDNLFYIQGRFPDVASPNEYYQALAYTVRDRMLHRWIGTAQTYKREQNRTVCYFSAEYLPGPHLANNLINLGIMDNTREAVKALGLDFDALLEQEEEPGLGNGGLGRLAACFMDSMATMAIPAIGYGIRYEFGIFDQIIRDGWQVEISDSWLRSGNPWEIRHPKVCFDVKIGGHTEQFNDEHGRLQSRWVPSELIRGVAHDTPVLGFGIANANLLRLWSAEATESFDFEAFNKGDYYRAVERKIRSETVSKVLYPNDEPETGKRLRLIQQYFFVSCSLQDMIRIYQQGSGDLTRLHEKYVVQLNDTHPAISVAELMRLLIDDNQFEWDTAWGVTTRTFAFTNHTLLPEALEKWPVLLFEQVLPRHLEIIYEINKRFLDQVRMHFLHDQERVARLSIIEEGTPRYVRMAHLACVGSFAINGVAELHTRLLEETVLRDFHDLWPERFHNKTNGVTPRRFMMLSNPGVCGLLTRTVGEGWARDISVLKRLERYADDPGFQEEWRRVKAIRKEALAQRVLAELGIKVDPQSLFDIQAKRIHEYKRQHLNVLHIITLYNSLKANPGLDIVPRTFIFGGKAAPGYAMAKLIIKLIHAVADVVNHDPDVADRLKVVFIPNFNVKVAQNIYPAADLSEQISTAGMEASGTGNMKFSMNGALTICTLDGANIEIREEVGKENFFLFGLTAEEVAARCKEGYHPSTILQQNPALQEVFELLRSGLFTHGDAGLFRPLLDRLMMDDRYMLLADYQSYIDCQGEVSRTYLDQGRWTRMSILNTARIGRFSSDRTIAEYNRDGWKVPAVPITIED